MSHHDTLNRILGPAASIHGSTVTIGDPAQLASSRMDELVRLAVFGATAEEKDWARWAIWEIGQSVGVRSASIHDLYMARGRGEISGFTVPAINVRGASYDTARAIFRTAIKLNAGAFIY